MPVRLQQHAVDVVDVDGFVGGADGLDHAADAEIAGLAQVDVTLRIWPDMVHIWPFFGQLSASPRATAESTAWIKARVP